MLKVKYCYLTSFYLFLAIGILIIFLFLINILFITTIIDVNFEADHQEFEKFKPGVDRDPENGFKRVYQVKSKMMDYSLLEVPARTYFRFDYIKPDADVSLNLELVDGDSSNVWWYLNGTIDSDTFVHLDFPVMKPRTGQKNPPIIVPGNLEVARRFGEIDDMGLNKLGLPLFKIELEVPPQKMSRFFYNIWRPSQKLAYRDSTIPRIRTGYIMHESRVLPQKKPLKERGRLSRLQLFNH